MERLSEATLDTLPPDVERPGYDRTKLHTGVVHIGIGAFHRAHQAAVFNDLIRSGDTRWGIRAASLRSPTVRGQMAPQDGLYSLVVRDGEAERIRIIGAVRDVLVAPEDAAALIEAMAAPDTHIVTLTVTEKGYLPDPADTVEAPRTAAAYIAAALALRRQRRLAPFTAISCDNLPHNGTRLRDAVLAVAPHRSARLDRGRGRLPADDGRSHRPPPPTPPTSLRWPRGSASRTRRWSRPSPSGNG